MPQALVAVTAFDIFFLETLVFQIQKLFGQLMGNPLVAVNTSHLLPLRLLMSLRGRG
jgi:hypothetical protein